jgi:hypothetical protein
MTMNSLAFAGSGCFGLVWGWYVGQFSGINQQRFQAYLFIGFTILLLPTHIYLLVDWMSSIAFLLAAGFTLTLHLAWLRKLGSQKMDQVEGVVQ